MSSDIAISVKNLTKTYRIFGHPGDRIKQAFTFGRVRFHCKFIALKDVSFNIKKGETVGIIGRNGSGKSTLLQLVCGIIKPTCGVVTVDGRVSALLELGAGFNPEFTGRENVYFQGAIMGIDKHQMNARFSAIADFADIGVFIDQPVRTYSSGMFVRLAFAVAISMDPDILVVDEALAVGDSKFQAKCATWLREQRSKGITVLLVSHDANLISSLCDRALLVDSGQLVAEGTPATMTVAYHQLLFGGSEAKAYLPVKEPATRYGTGEARLIEWALLDGEDRSCDTIVSGAPFRLYMKIRFMVDVPDATYGFVIKNRRGSVLWGLTNILQGHAAHHGRAGEIFEISATGHIWLAAGDYFVTLGAARENSGDKLDFIEEALAFQVVGPVGLFDDSIVNLQTVFAIEGMPSEQQSETT